MQCVFSCFLFSYERQPHSFHPLSLSLANPRTTCGSDASGHHPRHTSSLPWFCWQKQNSHNLKQTNNVCVKVICFIIVIEGCVIWWSVTTTKTLACNSWGFKWTANTTQHFLDLLDHMQHLHLHLHLNNKCVCDPSHHNAWDLNKTINKNCMCMWVVWRQRTSKHHKQKSDQIKVTTNTAQWTEQTQKTRKLQL